MTAILHRPASTPGKPAWEGSRRRRLAAPANLASTYGSSVLPIKTLQNRTFRDRHAPFADICQLAECLLHGLKASDLGVYIGNLGLRPRPDDSAGRAA